MKKKILIILGVLVLIGAGIGAAFVVDPQLQFKLSGDHEIFELEGELAPDFQAKVVGEERNMTLQELRGTPTVLVFFATFCPYCKAQMPEIQKLQKSLGDDADVILVNGHEYKQLLVAHRDTLVSRYLQKHDFTDLSAIIASNEMQETYRLSAIPTIMVLDREGTIRYVGLSNHTAEEIEDEVRPYTASSLR